MHNKKALKVSWAGGWGGSFIWVAVLAVVFFFRAHYIGCITGLIIAGVGYAVAMFFSPWKHPDTTYWKLMLAPYVMFFISIGWAIWAFGGIEATGFNWWNMLWVIPMLTPFGVLSNNRWNDRA